MNAPPCSSVSPICFRYGRTVMELIVGAAVDRNMICTPPSLSGSLRFAEHAYPRVDGVVSYSVVLDVVGDCKIGLTPFPWRTFCVPLLSGCDAFDVPPSATAASPLFFALVEFILFSAKRSD